MGKNQQNAFTTGFGMKNQLMQPISYNKLATDSMETQAPGACKSRTSNE